MRSMGSQILRLVCLAMVSSAVTASLGCAAEGDDSDGGPEDIESVAEGIGPAPRPRVRVAPPEPLTLGVAPVAPPNVPVLIQSVNIAGDMLLVDVTFSGGCAAHDFNLYWDGTATPQGPGPSKVALELYHRTNDPCKQQIHAELQFRLDRIQRRSHLLAGAAELHVSGQQVGQLYVW